MLDFVCLICGKMKGDKMYNESLSKIVFALVTVMWLKMKMKYEDILINLSQILTYKLHHVYTIYSDGQDIMT